MNIEDYEKSKQLCMLNGFAYMKWHFAMNFEIKHKMFCAISYILLLPAGAFYLGILI